MSTFDHHFLSLVIRWLHVGAMAAALGGALLLLLLAADAQHEHEAGHDGFLLRTAEAYEWLFWAAVGLLVATSVGNLGTLGDDLPESTTVWGRKLLVKLLGLLALLVLSLLRTGVVARLTTARTLILSDGGYAALGALYAGTALLLLTVLALAVSLAHG